MSQSKAVPSSIIQDKPACMSASNPLWKLIMEQLTTIGFTIPIPGGKKI